MQTITGYIEIIANALPKTGFKTVYDASYVKFSYHTGVFTFKLRSYRHR